MKRINIILITIILIHIKCVSQKNKNMKLNNFILSGLLTQSITALNTNKKDSFDNIQFSLTFSNPNENKTYKKYVCKELLKNKEFNYGKIAINGFVDKNLDFDEYSNQYKDDIINGNKLENYSNICNILELFSVDNINNKHRHIIITDQFNDIYNSVQCIYNNPKYHIVKKMLSSNNTLLLKLCNDNPCNSIYNHYFKNIKNDFSYFNTKIDMPTINKILNTFFDLNLENKRYNNYKSIQNSNKSYNAIFNTLSKRRLQSASNTSNTTKHRDDDDESGLASLGWGITSLVLVIVFGSLILCYLILKCYFFIRHKRRRNIPYSPAIVNNIQEDQA